MFLMSDSKVIVIEHSDYTMRMHDDGMLEMIIHEGVTIDANFVWGVKAEVESRRPGKKFFVLVKGIGFFNVTSEAREISASRQFSGHMAAVAFYTTNYSLKLLTELYNKINKPVVITRVFGSREPAVEWLRELMKQPKMDYSVFSRN